jgi:exopolyphosphatase/pppGpp-phosphohydrolase
MGDTVPDRSSVVEEGVLRPSRDHAVVAGIDCGTNTLKLLIGSLPDVAVRESRMVRLGQDLDRTGRISEGALARAFTAVDEYAALIAEHQVDRIRFCATSATRDASNRDVFVAGVRERLGVDPEVMTGHEEAALTFDGAVRNLRVPVEAPVLVVDVGGGSTELIVGGDHPDSDARSLARPSLGSVAHSRVPSTFTSRDRTHSPSPLACGSNRVDAATPSPRRPRISTLTAPRLGSR